MKNYLIYPTKIMSITQNYSDNFSHAPHSTGKPCDYPIDENCGTTARDYFYCPCDEMIIKRITGVGAKTTNTIWLQSTSKVVFANGEEDYCTILICHPDDDTLKPLKVGQTFKRKEKIFLEGKDGYATGNHFHISVSKGRYVPNGWKKNSKGAWVITGVPLKPEDAFFVDCGFTKVKKTQGLKFKNMPIVELPKAVDKNNKVDQAEVIVDRLRCRTSPKIILNNIIGFVAKGYYNILSIFTDEKYDWYEIEKGKWIANDGTFLKIYKKEEPIVPIEKPKEDVDAPTSPNDPITESKEEDSTNISDKDKTEENKPSEEEYDYGMRQEANNPLLHFFDWLFNLIRKIFKKVSK